MNCRCPANTLRLFIRSVAQVEVPSSARFPTNSSYRQIRQLSSTPGLRGQTFSRRAFSTTSKLRNPSHSPSASKEQKPAQSQSRNDVNPGGLGGLNAADAIVEFSPDAIDALAAEVTQMPYAFTDDGANEYKTPLQELLQEVPQRKPEPSTNPFSKTTIRRTKTENTSFALHFSSPRAPPLPPKPQSSLQFKPAVSTRNLASKLANAYPNDKTADHKAAEEKWAPGKRVREPWQVEKEVVQKKYPDGWNPLRRLSPDAMGGIRALNAQMPGVYTVPVLANEFKVSPEAIRRILKSKWRPTAEEETDRQRRWFKRGEAVWGRYAEMGVKPPKQWRQLGIGAGRPEWMEKKRVAREVAASKLPLAALLTTTRQKDTKPLLSFGERKTTVAAEEAVEDNLADRIL